MKNKKSKKAVALEYNSNDKAPKVIAKGERRIAEEIIQRARDENIPIYEDSGLVNTLNLLEIGEEIPPELYEVVAQVLLFVSDIDNLKSKIVR